MECGLKRKLDCIADMEVLIHPNVDPLQLAEHSKKMRLSVQLAASVPMDHRTDDSSSSSLVGAWGGGWPEQRGGGTTDGTAQSTNGMETEMEDKTELLDDIPSTTEVINSLRKVILWMSAQGDHNEDYIQYLSEVERYAKSKQFDVAQQRKITQYLIRRDQ